MNVASFFKSWFEKFFRLPNSQKCVLFGVIFLFLYLNGNFAFIRELQFNEDEIIRALFSTTTRNGSPNLPEFRFVHENEFVCSKPRRNSKKSSPKAVVLIKSAVDHRGHRDVIRRTWMSELTYYDMVGVFLLGLPTHGSNSQVDLEQQKNQDIVQQNFVDHYYNNTFKSILGWRWATTYCGGASFIACFDDDVIVNVDALSKLLDKQINQLDVDPHQLIGYVINQTKPFRTLFSKWYVSVQEYPWSKWPYYPSGAAYIMSMTLAKSVREISPYLRYFRIDDVFLGFLAMKLKVNLVHNSNIYVSSYNCYNLIKTDIACHTYGDYQILDELWSQLKFA